MLTTTRSTYKLCTKEGVEVDNDLGFQSYKKENGEVGSIVI